MKVWIEAYREDGTEILGNCDGQGSIEAVHYNRTKIYKHLRGRHQKGFPIWTKPYCWKIVTAVNRHVIEKITNLNYKK